jgi:hypothetical protein
MLALLLELAFRICDGLKTSQVLPTVGHVARACGLMTGFIM